MKKMMQLFLLSLFLGCTREDEIPEKLDLNGIFTGKITGYAQPLAVNGNATWVITHQGSEFSADITYENVTGFNVPKYKGTVINDTTFVGGFVNVVPKSIVNGKISKNGNQIICSTDGTDPNVNYVRITFDLLRK